MSWGVATAWPLPEIYRNDGMNAGQWWRISRRSAVAHGGKMLFDASLTQYGACQTRGCDPSLDNTPAQGWTQLQNRLNMDARTADPVEYSTDITWNN